MTGEKSLAKLLKTMKPVHNPGEFVFCRVEHPSTIDINLAICLFKEQEATTVVLKKEIADHLGLEYTFIASWITLTVHSSLEAIGLTAAFSAALAEKGISCNVMAGYYHDHIFVNLKDNEAAMNILEQLSK
ncbi:MULTISPECIES: ACT domain-containing protein [unclassified Pedobacter]|uniref:ACT domain-containing protein n=1 Tax=unclassified Pedobacter TaxID=2628915 RepID=UPI0021D469CA|nr:MULTISPECIES: ACT domain-containing protein [unclassified Pedobacter]